VSYCRKYTPTDRFYPLGRYKVSYQLSP